MYGISTVSPLRVVQYRGISDFFDPMLAGSRDSIPRGGAPIMAISKAVCSGTENAIRDKCSSELNLHDLGCWYNALNT